MAVTSSARSVRVVVVDDHTVLRESIELALQAEGFVVPRVELPEDPGGLAAAIAALTDARPRVALIDIDPGRLGDGLRLVAPLTRADIRVVAMTSAPVGPRWGEAVRYGASKVLSRTRPLADILATVHRVAADRPVMTREERDELVEHWRRGQSRRRETLARLDSLTIREAAVFGQLLEGRPVRTIAADSGVSEWTIRTQVRAVLTKLGVATQLAAVSLANEVGWRPPG